ncbi:WD repeat-containing protein 36 [Nematostella vectensis]|uniref:WD repeat-containing protein 36 n=1 Tax=Nematostella vectensis TaxID=45351 RepID=UPI002076F746|nr:WD repeat-containing protein 36 [Nematostella vectensis]
MAAVIGSQLFSPFRALGYIANHVPLAVQSQGTENLVVTAVGSAFHVYNCAKLNLLFVGQLNDEEVSCLTTYKHFVITACGQEIKMWHRGKTVASFVGHDKDVHCLLTFGAHLISVDEGSSLKVWDIKTTELYLEVGFDSKTFHITCLMHPSTYLNKILLCSKQGSMQIWNIKTNKMIYSFEGWSCPITAVEQAPAIDVVAVGLQSGKIVIHNLKVDETVMTFQQDWGPVTAIAFRTDGNPVMATASPSGNIALWDLEGRKLRSTLIDAHDGSVCGLKFLPSQPLLATNGPDNALKLWIFDQPDGSGRLLRSRSGHSAPPTKIRFYGHKGSDILSAGLDRTFRHISTANDARSCELSQGSLAKKAKNSGIKVEELKLTPITDFAAETTRNSDWENIVTCHQGNKQARSWWFQKKALGKHTLETRGNKDGDNTSITAVTISSCGNFAIIGDSKGHVDSFNIQSGNHRASYGNPRAHKGCVRGVAIDGVNQQLLSAGADSQLRFWSFTKRKLLSKLSFEALMTGLEIHRESSLAAVVCEDFSIHIADIEMHRIVRTFTGHANRITDVSFSPDGRWLISSSMDSTIRTWDLPAARLIDCFLVASPVTSLTLSPTGEYLATSHVDDLGVYLWSNKTLYGHVALVPLPSTFEPSLVQLPVTSGGETEEMSDAILETRTSGEVTDMGETQESRTEEFKSPDQLSNELITMSLLPQSRWRNLTSLEIIKQRNRPKQPPKPPKSAPFFLPTEPGLVPKFVAEEKDVADEEVSQSKLIQLRRLQPQTEFQKMLDKCSSSGDYDPLMSSLKAMGPSAIDAELRLVSPESGGTIALMQQFMEFLSTHMATKRDFELVEAYMALFLKLHGSLIMEHPELVRAARQLQAQHEHTWTKLRDLINQGLCLVSYYKSALI